MSEVTVKVQGTIELRIRCSNCENDLEIIESGYNRMGEFIVRVSPCEACIQEAIEEHIPDNESGSRSPFCDT